LLMAPCCRGPQDLLYTANHTSTHISSDLNGLACFCHFSRRKNTKMGRKHPEIALFSIHPAAGTLPGTLNKSDYV
jgi:hypothetical protein